MFDVITGLMERAGYIGIAILMFLENIFPPIPSELIMPLAGFTAARGEFSLLIVVLAGTAGSVAGAVFWYFIGRWIGGDRLKRLAGRHGRWLTLAPKEVDQATALFERHCGKAVLIGRLVPAVRTLISVPAGITRMTFGKFLAYSTLGAAVWTGALALAGYLLVDQHQKVSSWLNPVSNVVIGAIVVWYLYRVITFRPEQP